MDKFAPPSIVSALKKNPELNDVVSALSSTGYFSTACAPQEEKKEAYRKLVNGVQISWEQEFVKGLKKGEFKIVAAAILTPRPANPLSYKITDRTPVLEKFLKVGGILACVYPETNKLGVPSLMNNEEYAAASARYSAYRQEFPDTLWDRPVDDSTNKLDNIMSGASYLVETKNNEIYTFSIHSFQLQTLGTSPLPRDWELWSGKELDLNSRRQEVVCKRRADINSFLAHQTGIDMFTLLAHGRRFHSLGIKASRYER
ncbi:MAG: hypothetical protein WC464_02900 [Bdellovibrionales bacterium]